MYTRFTVFVFCVLLLVFTVRGLLPLRFYRLGKRVLQGVLQWVGRCCCFSILCSVGKRVLRSVGCWCCFPFSRPLGRHGFTVGRRSFSRGEGGCGEGAGFGPQPANGFTVGFTVFRAPLSASRCVRPPASFHEKGLCVRSPGVRAVFMTRGVGPPNLLPSLIH